MIHNPFKMQADALNAIKSELSPEQWADAIGYAWFSFDDLTHDGYSVVDYVTDIMEAVDEYGDVLQITDEAELRQFANDPEMRDIFQVQLDDDPEGVVQFMYEVAKAVDAIYEQYGPVYINTKCLEGPEIQFDTLDGT